MRAVTHIAAALSALGALASLPANVQAATRTPSVTLTQTQAPSNTSNATVARFAWTTAGQVAGTECSLVAALFTPCSSPAAYAPLAVGGHGSRVRVSSRSGATATTSASWVMQPASTLSASPSFVRRQGTQLRLDGKPYKFTGLNVYNANSRWNCWYWMGDGDALDATLSALPAGVDAFRAWFFQREATTNGQRDWRAFDHTLAAAKAHGVRVVVTLANQGVACEAGPWKGESWYHTGYRTVVDRGMAATYRNYVAEVVRRYKDDPTVLMWQLMNEAEPKQYDGGPCSSTANLTLTAWARDMAGRIKSIDRNHLVSLGTIGSGQCGTSGSADYKTAHNVPGIDVCEFHDYDASVIIPGLDDPWNGLPRRIQDCAEINRPLFVGEAGINPQELGGTLEDRASMFDAKIADQFAAGVVGFLGWDWRAHDQGGYSLTGFEIGPGDPALGVLASH